MGYSKANPVDPIDRSAFEAFCGVGVVITEEQIAEKVKAHLRPSPQPSPPRECLIGFLCVQLTPMNVLIKAITKTCRQEKIPTG